MLLGLLWFISPKHIWESNMHQLFTNKVKQFPVSSQKSSELLQQHEPVRDKLCLSCFTVRESGVNWLALYTWNRAGNNANISVFFHCSNNHHSLLSPPWTGIPHSLISLFWTCMRNLCLCTNLLVLKMFSPNKIFFSNGKRFNSQCFPGF